MFKPTGAAVEQFIARWRGGHGGQERANYAMFLYELCDVLGVTPPDPAGHSHSNDYVFERIVRELQRDGTLSFRRIDLYKRGCFVLEAKQSRQCETGVKQWPGPAELMTREIGHRSLRQTGSRWDLLMARARAQAENYVRLLPEDHDPPPFVVVCDVGHCFEIYANFRRDGKAYGPFPDGVSFRIFLEDLRRHEVRTLLQAIWTDPLPLDPARRRPSLVLQPPIRHFG
jgi:hypothetical protein